MKHSWLPMSLQYSEGVTKATVIEYSESTQAMGTPWQSDG